MYIIYKCIDYAWWLPEARNEVVRRFLCGLKNKSKSHSAVCMIVSNILRRPPMNLEPQPTTAAGKKK